MVIKQATFSKGKLWWQILSWSLSIFAGILFANIAADESAKLVYAAFLEDVSFFLLFFSLVFGLLLATLCINFHSVSPLILFTSLEGVSLGYCLMGALLSFGSAGWLVALALMWPHTIFQIILFTITFKYFTQNITVSSVAFMFCLILCFITVCIYIFAMLPFVNELLYLLQQKGIAYSCWI